MKNKTQHNAGFTAIEGLLVLIVILMVAFMGWFVWHSNQQAKVTYDQTSKTAATSVASPSKKTTAENPNTSPTDNQYLVIKEWGVKVNLGSGKDADKLTYRINGPSNNEDGDTLVDTAIVHYTGSVAPELQQDTIVLQKSNKQYSDRTTQKKIGNFWYDIGYSGDDLTPAGVTLNEWTFEAN